MKKLILGLLSLTFIVSSISAGVFGESVGGSFVGSTLSNVVTQPSRSYRNSGEAARAAIDLASQANSVAIRADEKINRLEYEVNKIRPMEIRINALEDRDRRLEEENRRLEQEVRSIRELIYKFRAETATFTEEEKKKMASQFTDGEKKKILNLCK